MYKLSGHKYIIRGIVRRIIRESCEVIIFFCHNCIDDVEREVRFRAP